MERLSEKRRQLHERICLEHLAALFASETPRLSHGCSFSPPHPHARSQKRQSPPEHHMYRVLFFAARAHTHTHTRTHTHTGER